MIEYKTTLTVDVNELDFTTTELEIARKAVELKETGNHERVKNVRFRLSPGTVYATLDIEVTFNKNNIGYADAEQLIEDYFLRVLLNAGFKAGDELIEEVFNDPLNYSRWLKTELFNDLETRRHQILGQLTTTTIGQ